MEFAVLGPLEVRRDGAVVAVTTPKQRALLILLILDVGRTVSVDRLVDDLWAGNPPPQAVTTLRSYISNLRHALDDPERTSPILLTRGRGYSLEVDPTSIDAIRFEALCHEARKFLETGDAGGAIAGVDAALALWRGPPLGDVAFENFAQGPIARLEELRLSAEEDRFEALLSLGRDGQAVAELQAFIAGNPLRERPRSQLMLALYRGGRAAEALSLYSAFRESLADELGLDPSPSLADLAERILRQSPDLELPDRETVGTPAAHLTPVPVAQPVGSRGPRLVGRDVEQGRMTATLDRLEGGRGSLVLVAGEPGIGKSALLRWLDAAATAQGLQVHWARCQQAVGVPPFWPWIQIVRSIASGLDDDELAAATRGAAARVTQVVDDLAGRLGVRYDASGEDPHEARFALHEAAITFLRRTVPAQGSVLILDDLHWAGVPSLELLTLLAPHLDGTPIVVAAAYRDLPAERSPALDHALAALAREQEVHQFNLDALSRDHTGLVVEDVTRVPPSEALVAAVHERTDGNPFLVHQLARLLDDSSGARHDGRVSTAIPVGARHVITRRLQLVPENTRQLLDAAAVVGRDFDLRIVSAAAQMSLDEALDAADEAVAHGLAEGLGVPVMSYRFVHTLIRDTVYDMLSPGRAALLHQAVGTALEGVPRPPVPALAEHFWRAADVTTDDRPLRYMVDAAEQALHVHAHEIAEEYLQRALHLLAHRAEDDTAAEVAIRHRLLRLISRLQGVSASSIEAVASRALDLMALPGMISELVPMWWSLWGNAITRGDYRGASELAERLLREARAHPDPAALAAGHLFVGYTAFFSGDDPGEQLRHIAEARSYADKADDKRLAAVPEHLLVCIQVADAIIRALSGRPGARSAMEEAMGFATSLGRPLSEVYARFFGGAVGAIEGDPEFSKGASEPGLEICRREGLRYAECLTTISHAWASAQLGRPPAEQARRLADAIGTLRGAGQRHGLPLWLILLAEVHLLAGETDAARAKLDEAEAVSAEIAEPLYADRITQLRRRCAAAGS